jgi:hypothetical protein
LRCATLGVAAVYAQILRIDHDLGARVNTIQSVILGMMLSWTPCVLLMAYLLWRAPLEPD